MDSELKLLLQSHCLWYFEVQNSLKRLLVTIYFFALPPQLMTVEAAYGKESLKLFT